MLVPNLEVLKAVSNQIQHCLSLYTFSHDNFSVWSCLRPLNKAGTSIHLILGGHLVGACPWNCSWRKPCDREIRLKYITLQLILRLLWHYYYRLNIEKFYYLELLTNCNTVWKSGHCSQSTILKINPDKSNLYCL